MAAEGEIGNEGLGVDPEILPISTDSRWRQDQKCVVVNSEQQTLLTTTQASYPRRFLGVSRRQT